MKYKQKKNRHTQSVGAQIYDEEASANPILKESILEIIDNQIRDNNPPETRQTLVRLLAAGYNRQQSVERLGSALIKEIWIMLGEHKTFDQARYVSFLDQLD
jgi:hypothetical protein